MSVKIVKSKKKYNEDDIRRGAVRKLFERENERILSTVDDESYWKLMAQMKKDYSQNNGFSKDRNLRHIARIPADWVRKAEKYYGKDVFKDKAKFKKAFAKNELGQWTLLVPLESI